MLPVVLSVAALGALAGLLLFWDTPADSAAPGASTSIPDRLSHAFDDAGDYVAGLGHTVAVNVRDFIKRLEGFSATAYTDDYSKTPQVEKSIGYGHQITGRETTTDPEALFEQDIDAATKAVAKYVRVPLTDNQRAALISLVYNIGAGQFATSTLVRKLNAGDYAGAAAEFPRWTKQGTKTLPALVARRAEEKALFTS